MGIIRVGPAGWSYKDWEGVVYPKPAPKKFDQLGYLASYFGALEINSTFYRAQPARITRGWAKRVAHNPDFRFTAKLNRRFTHERTEAWTRTEVKEAREGFDALQNEGRLGAVLLQFPWSFKRGESELEWLRDLFAAFDGLPLVLEVRHASWNAADFYRELEERSVGIVNIDQPLFHNSIRPDARITSRVGYVRVHGRNYHDWFRKDAGRDARYDYLYEPEQLAPWADRARSLSRDAEETYVVTNNHFRGQAVVNGLQLEAMLQRKKVRAPESLVSTFPEALHDYIVPPEAEASLHAP